MIEVVAPDGTTQDVTTLILSMGMTEGEPNGIVYLQRPLWAAFHARHSRLERWYSNLISILNSNWGADGQIKVGAGIPAQDATYGYLTGIQDDASGPPCV